MVLTLMPIAQCEIALISTAGDQRPEYLNNFTVEALDNDPYNNTNRSANGVLVGVAIVTSNYD